MIVSDSSTLIILFDLKKTFYLSNIFKTVYIPRVVFEEISARGEVKLPNFIKVKDVSDKKELKVLKSLLDDGESEAILLAKEMDKVLIIDEKKGRKIAKNYGLKIIGLLGIILLNYKKGFIDKSQAKDFLKEVINNEFRISKNLQEQFFKELK